MEYIWETLYVFMCGYIVCILIMCVIIYNICVDIIYRYITVELFFQM